MARTIVTGMLRCCDDSNFHIETDDGGYWSLDLPPLMIEPVDRLLNARVLVEGRAIRPATIAVSAVMAVD